MKFIFKAILVLYFITGILTAISNGCHASAIFYIDPNSQSLTDWRGSMSSDFDRDSTAYYEESGVMTSVAVDTPRYEQSGSRRYLRHEGAATNLISYSHDLTNWLSVRIASVDSAAGVRGASVNCGVVTNTDSSTHYICSERFNIDSSKTYCLSVWGKPGAQNWVQVIFYHYNASDGYVGLSSVYLDFDNEAVGNSGSVDSVWFTGESVNGFKRAIVRLTSTEWALFSGVAKVEVAFYPAEANNDKSFAGDGSTVDIYLTEVEFTQQDVPDSIVVTDGASASRVTEAYYPRWTMNAALQNCLQSAGTVIMEWIPAFDSDKPSATSRNILTTGIGNSDIVCFNNSQTIMSYDGTNLTYVNTGGWSQGDIFIIAVRFGYEDSGTKFQLGLSTNGGAWTWSSQSTFDGAYDTPTLAIGKSTGVPALFGRVIIYDTVMSQAAIESYSWPPLEEGEGESGGNNGIFLYRQLGLIP